MAVNTTVQVTMPQMGDSVTEGTVLEWHKQEGDAVAVDETIVEISTDKVDAEVPAPAAGTITKIHAGEGDTVEVGAVLAEITTNGAVPATAESTVSDEGDAPDGTPAADAAAEEEADQVDAQGNGSGTQVEAPPDEAPPAGAATMDIVAPPAGESVTEGTILEWAKQPGDAVQADETIVEISTDKVDMELPAPASGTLTEILAAEGETVTPGQVLGRMTVSEEAATAPVDPAPAPAEAAADAPAAAEVPDGARVSPVARRAAAAEGVDLGGVEGSGPGGRVTKADVLAAAGNGAATGTRPAAPAPAAAPDGEATPLKGAAAMLARYMDESRSIPTATSFRTLAVTVMDARRKELKAADKKVSFTHLIAYAIAVAATEDMPVMAHHFAEVDGKPSRVDDGQVNLGIAVDVEKKDGTRTLMVPVIRDAGRLPFAGFLAAFNDLIARARDNKLTADDLAGGEHLAHEPRRHRHGRLGPAADDRPGHDRGHRVDRLPGRTRQRRRHDRRSEGHDHDLDLRPPHHPGRGVRSLPPAHRGAAGGRGRLLRARVRRPRCAAGAGALPPAPAAAAAAARGAVPTEAVLAPTEELLQAVQAATSLLKAHRTHGHLAARLDPLGANPGGDPALDPEPLQLTPDLMAKIPAHILRMYVPGATLADALPHLREIYSGTVGYEIEHVQAPDERAWLRRRSRAGRSAPPRARAEARAAGAAQPGGGLRAVPAQDLLRPEALLAGGHGQHGADPRRDRHRGGRRGHARGAHRHGAPRPAQRAHPRAGEALPADAGRLPGRGAEQAEGRRWRPRSSRAT